MATTNTVTTLNALMKEVYAKKEIRLIPETKKILNMFPYKEEVGKDFKIPVTLTNEGGITYAGPDDDAVSLNSAIAMIMKDATVEPYQIFERSQLGYNIATRAKDNKTAFGAVIKLLTRSMLESITKRVEIAMLYGQSGLGFVHTSSNVSSTSTVLTMSAASWAPGIWVGSEGHALSILDEDAGAVLTANAAAYISSIDFVNRTITITGNATDIAAIDAACVGTGGSPSLYWYGAVSGVDSFKEQPGLDKIATNTGTLFGLSAATYAMWKGNVKSLANQSLTLARFDDALTLAVNKGLDDDAVVFISPKTWSKLMTDQAALREYDGSYNKKRAENGFQSLEFQSQNGVNEIIPYNIVKEGDAFVFPKKEIYRVGATDISLRNPVNQDEFFIDLENTSAVEMRAYSNQAIFCEAPCKCLKITDISNS